MIASPLGSLEFDEASHVYRLDGRELPSVTTLLEQFDPMYAVANLEEYSIRGSIIHSATEYHDQGELDESAVPEDCMGYLRGWQKFRREFPFDILATEFPFYHRTHHYAGRIDRVGMLPDNRYIVIDLKSGAERKTHKLQLAAYAEGYKSMLGANVKKAACVYLRADGTYSVRWQDDPNDLYDFLAMLRVARWRERNLK